MKIYISGKISGTDLTETRKRFAAVAKAMKRIDVEPVNPLENGLSEHDSLKILPTCYNARLSICYKAGKTARAHVSSITSLPR